MNLASRPEYAATLDDLRQRCEALAGEFELPEAEQSESSVGDEPRR